MKDRIKHIMEEENLTPAKFADRLQIGRAVISHILNGRNNPSLDVVTRILNEMDYINPEWLLNGSGEMYRPGSGMNELPREPDLVHQSEAKRRQGNIKPREPYENREKSNEMPLPLPEKRHQSTDNKEVDMIKPPSKEIDQIIIYYTDKTFEIFRR